MTAEMSAAKVCAAVGHGQIAQMAEAELHEKCQ